MLSCVFAVTHAQNITIRGKAHTSHIGKVITVYTYQDFLSKYKQKEDTDTIDKDGYFELKFYSKVTQPALVQIDNYLGELHVRPDYIYGIYFPEIDEKFQYYKNAELPVSLSFIGHDTTELNMLILDYDSLYNSMFMPKNNEFLNHNKLFARADSLKLKCDARYKGIKDDYFINYYNYQIAGINASLSRGEKFLISSFILQKPIQYKNYEYMNFFNACFSNYLKNLASSHKGTTLFNIINEQMNYAELDKFCKSDPLLQNDSLRELVIIKNLWDFYYQPEFSQEGIITILSKINTDTRIEADKILTDHILKQVYNLHQGSAAPMFFARNWSGGIESFEKMKGKWTYLNFFSTTNNESLKEMGKIEKLIKQYGAKMNFVSICVDDSLKKYIQYLKENPKYRWTIWYYDPGSVKQTSKDLYNVINGEGYFLIDNYGSLAVSPAEAPSKGIEYRLNAIFKPARKKTKTGIR